MAIFAFQQKSETVKDLRDPQILMNRCIQKAVL